MIQLAPEFLGGFKNVRIFGFFVDADELAVEHEGLAGGDGGLALAARHAEDHVAVDILVGERGERLIVHDDDVRRGAGLQHAERVGEVFFTDLRVILEEVIAVVAGVTYLNFNGCGVQFLQWNFTLPYAVYLLLIVILIWASINVVNCTDGVDGLSASLAVVTIGTYLIAYHEELADYSTAGVVFMGALLAYLWSNAKPSTLLMGDAGSRAMGFFIAILSLKCGHPFAFLLAAIVFIVDGSLGILKISLKRFLHISILKNTRTPLHDHVRLKSGCLEQES